jgi:hypothetical protein
MKAAALLCIALCAGCGKKGTDEEAQHDEVLEFVTGWRKKVLLESSLADFSAGIAADAVAVEGRGPEESEFDNKLDHEHLVDSRALLLQRDAGQGGSLRVLSSEARMSDGTVELSWRIEYGNDRGKDVVGERLKLRKDAAGQWKIHAIRTWPVERKESGKSQHFGDKFWKAIDAEVAQSGAEGHVRDYVKNLMEARRWSEAHESAVKWAKEEDRNPAAWYTVTITASRVGATRDAGKAYCKLKSLGRESLVPGWKSVFECR